MFVTFISHVTITPTVIKSTFFRRLSPHPETAEATWAPGRDGLGAGVEGWKVYTAVWRKRNSLKQTPSVRTPTDGDAAVREREKRRRRRKILWRLNWHYKWLVVSVWPRYSCKGHSHWEGYAGVQEGRGKTVRGHDGRRMCGVLQCSLLPDGGKQEGMLTESSHNFSHLTPEWLHCVFQTVRLLCSVVSNVLGVDLLPVCKQGTVQE